MSEIGCPAGSALDSREAVFLQSAGELIIKSKEGHGSMVKQLIGWLKCRSWTKDTIVVDDKEFEQLFEDARDNGDGPGNAAVSDTALKSET
ncbi:MAG: hypothetical protein LBT00_03450 [Spirochaetaceae bacterium]|jgi:hypothetical protein|nr:hypothetical protein [Spirochaetaceae bacterium]